MCVKLYIRAALGWVGDVTCQEEEGKEFHHVILLMGGRWKLAAFMEKQTLDFAVWVPQGSEHSKKGVVSS